MRTQVAQKNKKNAHPRKQHLQQLLAAIIPLTAILLIGAYGSQNVRTENSLYFSILFVFVAIITFVGEYQVIALMQKARSKQYATLTTLCQKFLAGDQEVQVKIRPSSEIGELAEAISQLMEQQKQLQKDIKARPAVQTVAVNAQTPENSLIKQQLQRIIRDLEPMSDGDLRVSTAPVEGIVGVIADTCNALVEELAQFVKWTRYASQVVVTTSQGVLNRSLEFTKSTESQIQSISHTTHNIEEIVAFMQHLSGNLHLSYNISKEVQTNIQNKLQNSPIVDTPLLQLMNEMHQQTALLESVLTTAEETSTLAESLIDELYRVAQQIYQSSVGSLKTIERLSELEVLAERWNSATAALTIEED